MFVKYILILFVFNIKVNRHDSILVPEITLVIKSIWNESLGDICFPYKENNKFFANKLIFD